METLNKIITDNKEIQISSFLQENCVCTLSKEFPSINIGKIKQFIKTVSLIEEIGEIEHSSDWDLYLEFQLENKEFPNNKSKFVTPTGFYNLGILENKFVFLDLGDLDINSLDEEDIDSEFLEHVGKDNFAYILISDIVSISLKG